MKMNLFRLGEIPPLRRFDLTKVGRLFQCKPICRAAEPWQGPYLV